MQLDASLDALTRIECRVVVGGAVQRDGVHLRKRFRADLVGFRGRQDLVSARESRAVVIAAFFARLVRGAVQHRKLDLVVGNVRDGDRFGGYADARIVTALVSFVLALLLRRDIGDEYLPPARYGAWDHVADVHDAIRELLFEHARLHFGGK